MIEQAIRVGFIGAGANTKLHHIPKLRAQPGVVLVGVANRSKASSEKVAKEFERSVSSDGLTSEAYHRTR